MAPAILEWPRVLVHNYFRVVGLVLLIIYSLWLRLWEGAKPALSPVLNIYHTVDHDHVGVTTIMQQFVRTVLMMGLLYWKTVMAVWDTVTRPFRKQLDAVYKFFEELQEDYKEVTRLELQDK